LTKPRTIVADNNPLFLQKLVLLLVSEFDVVAAATDGKSALDLIRRFQPDLVVVDLYMPTFSGIEITRELGRRLPRLPVVICTVEIDPEVMETARQAGAVGYVFKSRVEADLILALKLAFQGQPFVSSTPQEVRNRPLRGEP
jgi:DNA-binding NarL/FixJ family response regulator